ncbi:ABC transporter ATP-binding protein [Brucella intermedia]
MTDQRPLLRVRNLRTEFKSHRGTVRILDNVSFDVGQGRIVGLVGESGSGKSMTALSLMGLVPSPPATVSADSIMLDGVELTTLTKDQLRSKRGRDMSMVFQEPMTSFNPVITMAQQVGEPLQIHGNFSKRDVRDKVRQMFEMVGIPEAKARLDAYPHELSGGLRQRAMIAMGLICEPKLLIADEPTTALDVTTQAQILRLIMELRDRVGTAIIMITHDLGIIAEMCDEVNVMYAGQIIEQANVYDVFDRASHPYTRGLLASIPKANEKPDGTRLKSINGMVPSFKAPDLNLLENGHKARCWLHDKAGASL